MRHSAFGLLIALGTVLVMTCGSGVVLMLLASSAFGTVQILSAVAIAVVGAVALYIAVRLRGPSAPHRA